MRALSKKPGLLKAGALLFLILFVLFLLFAAIFAITQEAEDDSELFDLLSEDTAYEIPDWEEDAEFEEEGEREPEWMPPGPPRWFRSNAGGMTLEEIPSRLAALRNEYALVIDYVNPAELEPFLSPFYFSDYSVEIRILYEAGEESRKQWLFRDEPGNVRLNAVFRWEADEPDNSAEDAGETSAGFDENSEDMDEETHIVIADNMAQTGTLQSGEKRPVGFIEIFNENSQIAEDYRFTEEGEEIQIIYFYSTNIMIMTETRQRASSGGEFIKTHTDFYRYNRSFSLRYVERQYHGSSGPEPVRLSFPGRILDAAADKNFMSDKLSPNFDFFGSYSAGEGYRVVFNTDERGRILSQSMLDDEGETVWTIINTWSGDRILSVRRIEGEEEKITEFEYDSSGNRIVQRDILNGVLERLVRIDGDKETEELYMNGIVVLIAYWEDGRKIAEERVRRR